MCKFYFLFLVIFVVVGISITSLHAQATSVTAGCDGGNIRPGDSCSNPLYVCEGNRPISPTSWSCVCRWGDFESIDLSLVPGVGAGTTICDVFKGSLGTDKRGGVVYILNYVIIMLVALVIMVALISTIIGGYIYMTAGGSADRVKVAKTWIVSALLGVVIALSAWIVLGVVNPYLLGG